MRVSGSGHSKSSAKRLLAFIQWLDYARAGLPIILSLSFTIVPAHCQVAAQDLGILSWFKAENMQEKGSLLLPSLFDLKSSARCQETSKQLFLWLF